jgi:hypothetical protein
MVNPRMVVSRGAGGASGNKASTWTRLATMALAVGMMAALAAPAWGQSDDVTLRRDGSKAVPFVTDHGPYMANRSGIALRRDGSKAVPLVAEVTGQGAGEPPVHETAIGTDGFDWGDAAIGVGLGAAAALLTMGAVIAVRRRSTTRAASATAASS